MSTNEVIETTSVSTQQVKKKRSLTEKLEIVNDGWSTLDELDENRFKIPERKKQVDVSLVENEIIRIAKSDEDAIRQHEEKGKQSINVLQKEIANIRNAEKQSQIKAQAQQILESPSSIELEDDTPVQRPAQKPQQRVQQPVKTKAQREAEAEELLEDKNVFFKLVMKGLAQLYVDKTTSLLNPVVFIARNINIVLQTLFLLGCPAFITWYLLTQVSGLQATFTDLSATLYVFYSIAFYAAALFLCLTLLVLGLGIWAMIKRSMSDVAVSAKETS